MVWETTLGCVSHGLGMWAFNDERNIWVARDMCWHLSCGMSLYCSCKNNVYELIY